MQTIVTSDTQSGTGRVPAREVARPAHGPAALKWRALSLLMRTAGRASEGIRLGYRHGFDSGPMLDYVYENRARGSFVFGRLVDRVYLDSIGWRAIRARK